VIQPAIALNRFGLGTRPGDHVSGDAKRWLTAQFDRFETNPMPWAGIPGLATSMVESRDFHAAIEASKSGAEAARVAALKAQADFRQAAYAATTASRLNSALATSAPFVERLVHFWANHFAVSVEKGAVKVTAGLMERDAIRAHVLGRFEDLLIAVEQHPAMMDFLDQRVSLGPNSQAAHAAARNGKERGLNENLAREILELHTLGVRSGYSQADVAEFARALTGWHTVSAEEKAAGRAISAPGSFSFRPNAHEPGARTILGKVYAQPDQQQPLAILHDLANHSATATFLATKLVRHFIADDPPLAAVARVATAFRESHGDLPSTYAALVAAPEAWAVALPKFKSPWDWTVSALRGLGCLDATGLNAPAMLKQLGQPIWMPGSPAGFADTAANWAGPDALLRRVEEARRLANLVGIADARALADVLLPDVMSATTRTAIARAANPQQGLVLLLVSPEFMRR
jgi:uncharacterized protein (DUF1800 family)